MCIANMTVVKTGERREEIPTASNEHPDSLVSSVVLMVLDIGMIYTNVDLVSGLYPDIM